ncbi:MAG: hypothetical protein R6X32_04875 [Chloroflexota bacterium]
MLKLRLMMEDVAEKFFGRFLPQTEAQANCWMWEYRHTLTGHCCSNNRIARKEEKRWVNPCGGWYNEWQYVGHFCDQGKCPIYA